MNQISLTGFIASTPVAFNAGDNLSYTSFRLSIRGRYLDEKGDEYIYDEQHRVICVGKLDQFIRIIPRDEEIEVRGELRSRIHSMHIGGPIDVEVAYPYSEVVANSITWRDLTLKRVAGNDTLIALYKPGLA